MVSHCSLIVRQLMCMPSCHHSSSLTGSRSVPWADPEGEFPQSLLCQVIAEVIEERYDVILRLQRVAPAKRNALGTQ